MNTENLGLYLTPASPGDETFKNWRQEINGESDSNMTKIDYAYGELLKIASGLYDGTNLTVKFADEISEYTSVWSWIKDRVNNNNLSGIYVSDYIPFSVTLNNTSYTFTSRVAGIKMNGNNNIDFIADELWPVTHPIQAGSLRFNNGTNNTRHPWLACDMYYWLNSLSGTVPSAAEPGGGSGTTVDYSNGGVYYYLPQALKSVIAEKRAYIPRRNSSSELLTESDAGSSLLIGKLWLPSECEVTGVSSFSTKYDIGNTTVQYPLFTGNMKYHRKKKSGDDNDENWWLLSISSYDSERWCNMRATATVLIHYTSSSLGVPICFRIEQDPQE